MFPNNKMGDEIMELNAEKDKLKNKIDDKDGKCLDGRGSKELKRKANEERLSFLQV